MVSFKLLHAANARPNFPVWRIIFFLLMIVLSLSLNTVRVVRAARLAEIGPVVTGVSSPVLNGVYGVGMLIPITVTFDVAVNVTGIPQLTLETGATDQVVDYSGGSGSNTLTFNYTVQTGDTNPDLDYVDANALALNGGAIQDGVANNAILTLPMPGAAGSLGANKNIAIDWDAATVTGVTSTNGSYTTGALLTITVTFSEAVNVTGVPQLTLETGATDRVANYTGGSGTTMLTFEYTVQAGDEASDLDYVNANALSLNGGTIQDTTMTDAALTLPAPGASGSLGTNNAIVIDAVAPETSIESGPASPTNATNASFTFSGADNLTPGDFLNFECKLDTGSFLACSSGSIMYPGPLAEGNHTFQVRAIDSVGNADPTPASYTWEVDTTPPTGAMSSTAANPTNVSPIPVTVQFSETVSGFVQGDIVPTNATVGSFTMLDGDTYTFDLIPTGQGMVSALINDGSFADEGSLNFSTVDITFSRVYDSAAPTVTINQKISTPAQSDPTSLSPINFTVVFSEAINLASLTNADITLSGTAATGATATVTQTAPMNGTTFNVAVGGMSVSGTVTASITANKVTDPAGNNNTASTSTDNTVTFNATPVTVTINQAAGQIDPDFADSASKSIHFTAVFSEGVTGFTGADVSFTGTTLAGTLSATVTEIAPMNGTTYDVAVKGMIPKGTVFVSIPAGGATSSTRGVGNQASTSTDNNVIVDYVLVEFTSTAARDGWVLESTETSGVGGSNNDSANTLSVGDDASDRQYRSVVDFGTGSLPDDAVFFSINFRMIQANIVGTNPFNTHGLLKSEIKSGFFGSAAALQNPDFQGAPDALACNFEIVPEFILAVGDGYRCIVDSAAFSHINTLGNTQFRLRFTKDDNNDNNADVFNFYSGNHISPSHRPRLFIKYYVPP